MTDASAIRSERPEPGVAVVTIDRPARRNALTFAMWVALAETFEALSDIAELRAVILTGAGGAFSAGADIHEFSSARAGASLGDRYAAAVARANRAILHCPMATFAAISGPAMGGGCGLALCCDFRIGDATARLGIPAARLGLVYGVEETRALVAAVGVTRARELLYWGRPHDASAALVAGLLSEICPADPVAAAMARAASLAGSAPLSIAGAKRVIRALQPQPSAEDLAEIAALSARAIESADHAEGVAAFAARRPPVFTGR